MGQGVHQLNFIPPSEFLGGSHQPQTKLSEPALYPPVPTREGKGQITCYELKLRLNRCADVPNSYRDSDLMAAAVRLGGWIIGDGGGSRSRMVVGRRRLGGRVLVVAPVAVTVAVPVVAPGRGAGSGPVAAVAAPGRRWRQGRGRRELVLGGLGPLVLRDVGLRVPVVEVAGGAVDEAAPRLGQRRVVRRVPRGRAPGRASPARHRIWARSVASGDS